MGGNMTATISPQHTLRLSCICPSSRSRLLKNVMNFYCDCSSYAGDNKYAVVGGIAVRAGSIEKLSSDIQKIKDEIGMESEFKWSAYRGGRKRVAYEKLIELFFVNIESKTIQFHSMIVDFEKFDHHKSGRGSRHLSVNKLYYQLMLHVVCKEYGQKYRIVMFPDHGPDSDSIIEYRAQLCAQARKKHSTEPNCLRAIQPLQSDKCLILQMNDVIIGAIAAHREVRALASDKAHIRDYVLSRSPVTDYSRNTTKNTKDFTIWNFQT